MKRIISAFLTALMLISVISAMSFPISAAEKTEITVKWNSGYVGGDTNSGYKNKLSAASATYKYTDIIKVPKAGTKITFTDASCAGDSGSYYVSNTAYVFSSWKDNGDIDLEGANIVGTYQFESIGQKPVSSNYTDGMNYEFVTDRDNQNIRICYRCTAADTETPKVYSEATTDPSTLALLNAREFTATLGSSGNVEGLKWFSGYASSATNTNGSAKECKYYSTGYAFSNMFKIPKKGTEITYTLTTSTASNNAYNAFTLYKLNGTRYVYADGYAATDSRVVTVSGTTYTFKYITSEDNEVMRVCCRPGTTPSGIEVTAPVTVKWKATTEGGTSSTVLKTEWPDAEILSIVTGAKLVGTEVKDLAWVHGYVGSQYHDSAKFAYTSPTNTVYYTSDAFTVPKAGTTVYFFDQMFTDFDGGINASTSVMSLSHWKKLSTGALTFDQSKPYYNGCDCPSIQMNEYYRVYTYTTTEDNEMLRLCLRLAPKYANEEALIPPVYLVEKSDMTPFGSATEGLAPASYTDGTGSKVDYKIYLPGDYNAETRYSLLFDTSSDGALAKAAADNAAAGCIAVAFSGEHDIAMRLLDEIVKHYRVKVADILFAGGDELGAHLATYEDLRLAQCFLYTGSGKLPTLEFANEKALSEFADTTEALKWMLGEYDNYYPVLEGIKMYAIGDSYFGGSAIGQYQTWVNLLGKKYGMTYHNYGIGGNTVAVNSQTGSNQPAMCTRYRELPTDGDVYILEGGRNDRHYSVPFGENDSVKPTDFTGALNIMIKYIREKAPDALIVLVTPWSHKSEGKGSYIGTNDDYADTMQKLADYYNDSHIVCLYAADTEFTGINMSIAATRAKYCITASDVSHLNVNGMNMVLPKFDKWIAEKYAALRNVTLTDSKTAPLFNETKKPVETTTATVVPVETTIPTEVTTTGESETTGCANCSGSSAIISVIAIITGFGMFAFVRRRH